MGRYLLLLFEYEYLLEYDLLSLLENRPTAKTRPYTPMLNNQVNASQCISGKSKYNLFKIESKIPMARHPKIR